MPKRTEDSADRTVAPKQLVALITEANREKDKIQSIAGSLGERVKHAIENGHLHRGAFQMMVRLYKMEEFKREDFIRQMNLYICICRENELFGPEHVGDLVEQAEGSDEADGDDPRPRFLKDDGDAAEGAADVGKANSDALAAGIKELKPKGNGRGRKGALEGADAPGTYSPTH